MCVVPARTYLNSVLGKVEDGSWQPDTKLTVRPLLEAHWLSVQRARTLRATTLAGYEGAVNSWTQPCKGSGK